MTDRHVQPVKSYSWRLWQWQSHRLAVDRVRFFRRFSSDPKLKRVLVLTEENPISRAQLFPFMIYARELRAKYRVDFRELPVRRFVQGDRPYTGGVDAVCFQTWFTLTAEEIRTLVEHIRSTWPTATVAYFDWFAPTDLRYADALSPCVDVYVKKQILTNFSLYNKPTRGDTNLTDFYGERFSIPLPQTQSSIPAGFVEKLVLGSGFEYSPQMLQLLRKPFSHTNRCIDVHARLTSKGAEWYSRMRLEAIERTADLNGRYKVVYDGSIAQRQYFDELRKSKICFSPFGYGEVCWRDFEAMSTGALLLKPDMSHLRLSHDFFKPYETYVPLAWDLSDLEEKIAHFTQNSAERARITRNAFDQMRNLYERKTFVEDSHELLRLLKII